MLAQNTCQHYVPLVKNSNSLPPPKYNLPEQAYNRNTDRCQMMSPCVNLNPNDITRKKENVANRTNCRLNIHLDFLYPYHFLAFFASY